MDGDCHGSILSAAVCTSGTSAEDLEVPFQDFAVLSIKLGFPV